MILHSLLYFCISERKAVTSPYFQEKNLETDISTVNCYISNKRTLDKGSENAWMYHQGNK